MEKEGVIALAMVPIVSKQRAMGFIAVGSKKLHEFTDREVHLVSAFSSQLGAALENARLYDTVQAQAAQLSDLNKTLEHRVEEQVTQLERFRQVETLLLQSTCRADSVRRCRGSSQNTSSRNNSGLFGPQGIHRLR